MKAAILIFLLILAGCSDENYLCNNPHYSCSQTDGCVEYRCAECTNWGCARYEESGVVKHYSEVFPDPHKLP